MILETITTDIHNCVEEIAEIIQLEPQQQRTIIDILTDAFGTRLSEHSSYIDNLSWEPEYED